MWNVNFKVNVQMFSPNARHLEITSSSETHGLLISLSVILYLCSSLFLCNRPFIKLKDCSGGRPNISRSSSSTSSFSSTTGETEALEELETVSAVLEV